MPTRFHSVPVQCLTEPVQGDSYNSQANADQTAKLCPSKTRQGTHSHHFHAEKNFGKSDDSQVINGKPDNFLLVEKEHRNLPREKYKGNSDQCSPAYQKPNGNMVS